MTKITMTDRIDKMFVRFILGKANVKDRAKVQQWLKEDQLFVSPETEEEFPASNHMDVCEISLNEDAAQGHLAGRDLEAFIAHMNTRHPELGVTRETIRSSMPRIVITLE